MHDDEPHAYAWFIGSWFVLTILQALRFYFGYYSANDFVFLGDLIVPKIFFLLIAAGLMKEKTPPALRYVIFLTSVLAASTLPELWAPFLFAMGVLIVTSLLAGLAFFMEFISGSGEE